MTQTRRNTGLKDSNPNAHARYQKADILQEEKSPTIKGRPWPKCTIFSIPTHIYRTIYTQNHPSTPQLTEDEREYHNACLPKDQDALFKR